MITREIKKAVPLCLLVVLALLPLQLDCGAMRTSAQQTSYRVAGTVRRATDGSPLPSMTVKLFSANGAPDALLATAVTDGSGRYEVKVDQIPGSPESQNNPRLFSLQVFNPAGQPAKTLGPPIEVKPGTDVRVDINLLPSEIGIDPLGRVHAFGKNEAVAFAAARLSGSEMVEAYLFWRRPGAQGAERLTPAQREFISLLAQGDPEDECGEGTLSAVVSLLKELGDERLVERLIKALTVNTHEKMFFTGHVVVFYTLYEDDQENGVKSPIPSSDCPLETPNGIFIGTIRANRSDLPSGNAEVPPLYVQQVGLIAEHAWRRFVNPPLSFRDPRGKAELVEVRIQAVQDGAGGTGPAISFIEIRPDNSLDQNFATVPHEIFHRVQYQYNDTDRMSGLYGVMREGGARFIEDSFNDTYNRYVFNSPDIFNYPGRSLVDPCLGCANPIRYASALFWKYVVEQHSRNVASTDEPDIGVDAYRQMLETTAKPTGGLPRPYDVTELRKACAVMARPGSFDEFRYFDAAETMLDTSETTWGNYLVANLVHGTAVPPGERRFNYLEDQDAVTWPQRPAVSKLASLSAIINPEDDIVLGRGGSERRGVMGQLPYAARYYRIRPSAASPPRALRVSVSASGGMSDPLIQVLRFGPDQMLVDISRSDRPSYTQTVNMSGLSSVVLIVASRMRAGDFTVSFEEVPGGPDVMVTRWNSAVLMEYEVNPRDYPWTRTSPDVIVDTDDDLRPDTSVSPGVNNKLKVRVRNRGNVRAEGVRISFAYQSLAYRGNTPRLDPTRWLYVRDAAKIEQFVTGLGLAPAGTPGDEYTAVVNWAPVAARSNSGWCVKVTVSSPGDPNGDNKTAISCFARASRR